MRNSKRRMRTRREENEELSKRRTKNSKRRMKELEEENAE